MQFGGRRMRNNNPAFLACHVCGDRAPNHIHYGGIACFSCRAFFRRSVPKYNNYFCMAEGDCKISASTRKNCQYCRYQACLRAGMKSSWVLSDKEKLERTAKKMANRAKRIRQQMKDGGGGGGKVFLPHYGLVDEDRAIMHSRSSSTGSTTSSHSASSPAASPPLSSAASLARTSSAAASAAYAMLMLQQQGRMTLGDEEVKPIKSEPKIDEIEAQLDIWLSAQASTRHSVPMPSPIMSELIRMTTTGQAMSAENMVDLFRTGYSRVAAFARAITDFSSLEADTRKKLLSKNLDIMSNLRMCSCLNSDGSGDLLSQLRQAGRSDNVEYALGPKAIQIEQVFAQPWAKSQEHQTFYCSTIR